MLGLPYARLLIAGVTVPVNDSVLVQVRQAAGDVGSELGHGGALERTHGLEQLVQRAAVDVLHEDRDGVVRVLHAVLRHDVRVPQVRDQLQRALVPLQLLRRTAGQRMVIAM